MTFGKGLGFLILFAVGVCTVAGTTLSSAAQLQSLLSNIKISLSDDAASLIFNLLVVTGVLSAIAGAGLSAWELFFATKPLSEKRINDILAAQSDVRLDDNIEVLSTDQIKRRPADLLIARYRKLPYDDRFGHRSETLRWCETRHDRASGRDVSVRLITGGGGFGKTRLAIETLKQLRDKKWVTGFLGRSALRDDAALACVERLLTQPRQKGYCLAIDYAGIRPEQIGMLLDRLARLARADRKLAPIRVLLLARQSDWWTGLADSGDRLNVTEQDPYPLTRAAFDLDQRVALFDAAIRAFAPELAKNELAMATAYAEAPRDLLGQDLYNRPLTVAIAAFLILRGKSVDDVRVGLFDALIDEERKNWRRAADDDADVQEELERAAFQATLAGGGFSVEETMALRTFDPRMADRSYESHRAVGRKLVALYPVSSGFIGGVEPDILGEAFVARTLIDDDELLRSVFRWVSDGKTEHVGQLLATIIRMGYHPENLTRLSLGKLFESWIDSLKSPKHAFLLTRIIPESSIVLEAFAERLSKKAFRNYFAESSYGENEFAKISKIKFSLVGIESSYLRRHNSVVGPRIQ